MRRSDGRRGGFEISGIGVAGLWKSCLILLWTGIFLTATPGLTARERDALQYGAGLIVNVPFPESEVVQVVQDVVQNGIIRGTKEYNKDEYVANATSESWTRAFPGMDRRWEGLLQSEGTRTRSPQFQGQRRRGYAGCPLRGAGAGGQKQRFADRCGFRRGFPPHLTSIERFGGECGVQGHS